MRPEILGDDWVEGMPDGDAGLIEILTIGTMVSVDAVPQVRRYFRRLAVLPTIPGYYLAGRASYGGPVVVELLNSPAGQWVDAGDRNYLDPDDVRALGPLVHLEPRPVTAKAVLDRVRECWIGDNRIEDIALEFGAAS